MSKSFIHNISIQNFKSIQSCEINNCNRINLFIGKPNVGKSNIIEALSLFSITFLKENTSKKLSTLLRLENSTEIFYNGDSKHKGVVKADRYSVQFSYNPKSGLRFDFDFGVLQTVRYDADENLVVKGNGYLGQPIRRYTFNADVRYKRGNHKKYLIPPYGFNLMDIIEGYPNLKDEVIGLFREYDLDIVFDIASQTMKVQQVKNGNYVFQIPYNSTADTLRRLIFFKVAIASNDSSVLLFEEPEAHSFPPYMSRFTQDMINKKDNQFFIATHSPYIVNDLLENAREELSIYMVDYPDKQTVVKQLTNEQLHDIYQYGVDLFTNSESFI